MSIGKLIDIESSSKQRILRVTSKIKWIEWRRTFETTFELIITEEQQAALNEEYLQWRMTPDFGESQKGGSVISSESESCEKNIWKVRKYCENTVKF